MKCKTKGCKQISTAIPVIVDSKFYGFCWCKCGDMQIIDIRKEYSDAMINVPPKNRWEVYD